MKSTKLISQPAKITDSLELLSKMLMALDNVNELDITKLSSKFFSPRPVHFQKHEELLGESVFSQCMQDYGYLSQLQPKGCRDTFSLNFNLKSTLAWSLDHHCQLATRFIINAFVADYQTMNDQDCRALADFMMASILALLRNPPHQRLLAKLLDSNLFAQYIFHEELPRYSTSEETISSATFSLHRLRELQFSG